MIDCVPLQDNFHVASPLAALTKDEVRSASKELGLPNWSHAASPCLRSRLALNVEVCGIRLTACRFALLFALGRLTCRAHATRQLPATYGQLRSPRISCDSS